MSIGVDELPRRIVLCEGIHDTAFWGAALKRLGCSKDARDPVSGKLGFASKTGAFIRLFQKGQKPKWKPDVSNELIGAATQAVSDIVLCADLDSFEDQPDFVEARKHRKQDMLRLPDGVSLANGKRPQDCWDSSSLSAVFPIANQPVATRVSVALWGAGCASDAGIPRKQTLERLICAAFVFAYPGSAWPVEHWLGSRSAPPALSLEGHKALAAAYMAGWYAKRDYQGFFQAVWEDQAIAEQLERLLQTTGTWAVIERVAV